MPSLSSSLFPSSLPFPCCFSILTVYSTATAAAGAGGGPPTFSDVSHYPSLPLGGSLLTKPSSTPLWRPIGASSRTSRATPRPAAPAGVGSQGGQRGSVAAGPGAQDGHGGHGAQVSAPGATSTAMVVHGVDNLDLNNETKHNSTSYALELLSWLGLPLLTFRMFGARHPISQIRLGLQKLNLLCTK